ncbi:cupredoxin domain-containing protein [Candidatus Nitronereus thalassa]|uniref:Cupredoxin domain-containing protein n=1 Tax=Candidatus Nitronereus thalassa TaxID=3020898 RepID=A0ABU3K4C8_9BACT|nr:cupredoxin domain-containing protein [Candidatus Nitronereus thalassa]MDT7041238.1 cupredoxin domain-containing protein [Candidatus Nitronereus thalassa]
MSFRKLRKSFRVVVLGSLLQFLLFPAVVGWGDEPSKITLTPGEDGVQRVTIKMESYAFTPNEIIIRSDIPVSIQLENHSFLVPHNFVIENSPMGLHHEVDVSAGDVVNLQLLLTSPGHYTFFCDKQLLFFPSHREEGMEGHLEVR